MPGDIALSTSPNVTRRLRHLVTPLRLALVAVASLLVWLTFAATASGSAASSPTPTPLPLAKSTPRLRQLKGTSRAGLGGRLQRACGEMDSPVTYWLDTFERLEQGSWCAPLEGGDREREALVKAASRQCGSWCIWDLASDELEGWSLEPNDQGGCFVKFTSPHHCDEWVGMRDKLFEEL